MKNTPKVKVRQLPNGKLGMLKIETGRTLHAHEVATINKLLSFGHDIYCQIEANLPYINVADIMWQNEQWEIKNVTANSQRTIEDSLRKAKRQSSFIIMDISASTLTLERSTGKIAVAMRRHRSIKKVMIFDESRYCTIDKSMI